MSETKATDFKALAANLKALIEEHPHIEKVFLLEDGSYTLNAHEYEGELYSRVDPDVAFAKDPALLQAKYKIVSTATREDILRTYDNLHGASEELKEQQGVAAPETKHLASPEETPATTSTAETQN